MPNKSQRRLQVDKARGFKYALVPPSRQSSVGRAFDCVLQIARIASEATICFEVDQKNPASAES
jgi:hypothetical protein